MYTLISLAALINQILPGNPANEISIPALFHFDYNEIHQHKQIPSLIYRTFKFAEVGH